tara:strand:+ start:61 stop:804 length:744 start_codon:yes stop_codon:yes gene_type:complete
MPIVIEVDESVDPRTTGTYEPDRIPQGFQAPDTYGRMRPNEFSGAKIGGGYDAPRGTPTWEPSWDQNAGITHQDLGGYEVMPAGGSKWSPRYWWQRGSDWEHGTNLAEEYLMGDEGMAQANRAYNKFQIRANEPDARAQRLWMYNQARDENKQPMFFDTVPAPDDPYGDWIHRMRYFDTPETLEASAPDFSETELAQSQWRRPENMEKTIDVLEIRPEFEGWSRDEIKAYIFRSTRQANRGGIIGLI